MWHKSIRSNPSGNCVEVDDSIEGTIQVRNSHDPAGPVVAFTLKEWDTFIAGAKDGEFDFEQQGHTG